MKTSTKIAIALGVILLVVVGFTLSHRSSKSIAGTNPGGGDVIQAVNTFIPGIVIGGKFMQWQPLTLPIGTNQASWKNTTGQVVYVAGARFSLASTTPAGNVSASSTLALSVGTSTGATITDAQSVYGGLINQILIATSTTAFDAKSQVYVGGATGVGLVSASSTIAVAPGEYLFVSLESPYQSCVNAGTCESATSTKRGYVLNGLFEYSF